MFGIYVVAILVVGSFVVLNLVSSIVASAVQIELCGHEKRQTRRREAPKGIDERRRRGRRSSEDSSSKLASQHESADRRNNWHADSDLFLPAGDDDTTPETTEQQVRSTYHIIRCIAGNKVIRNS